MISAAILGLAFCTVRRKDNLKKMLQMFPDDDIRETIINYADGAGEENTVIIKRSLIICLCQMNDYSIK
jgi:hypothetical protein